MRSIGGFHADEINFYKDNDEILMNPLKIMGISPIEQF